MMGPEDQTQHTMIARRVEEIFSAMDEDKDGVVTEQEFRLYCTNNTILLHSIAVLSYI